MDGTANQGEFSKKVCGQRTIFHCFMEWLSPNRHLHSFPQAVLLSLFLHSWTYKMTVLPGRNAPSPPPLPRKSEYCNGRRTQPSTHISLGLRRGYQKGCTDFSYSPTRYTSYSGSRTRKCPNTHFCSPTPMFSIHLGKELNGLGNGTVMVSSSALLPKGQLGR